MSTGRREKFRLELLLDRSEKRRYDSLMESAADLFAQAVRKAADMEKSLGILPHPVVLANMVSPPEWMREEAVMRIAAIAAVRARSILPLTKTHVPIEVPYSGVAFSTMEPLVVIPYLGTVKYRPSSGFSVRSWDLPDDHVSLPPGSVRRCSFEDFENMACLVVEVSDERPERKNLVRLVRKA